MENKWTIKRNWQHWVHKIQDEDKQNKIKYTKTQKKPGMNLSTHEG